MFLSDTCPHCGFHASDTTSSSFTTDDASLFRETIQQIEDIILLLKEEKAKLSNLLNRMRASTRSLPNQILSTVFEYASQLDESPSEDFYFSTDNPTPLEELFDRRTERYFPLYTLGQVCSDWRQIAWSTSSLWTRLNLNVDEDRLLSHNFGLPRLFLDNSRNRTLRIFVDCRKAQQANWTSLGPGALESEGLEESLDPLRDLIFYDNAHRITQMLLNCPPPEWLPLLSEAFTILEWIELGWPQSKNILPQETISLVKLPCLKRVSIRQVAVVIELPWEQITHLEIRDISFEVASQLITSCPNLIECDARGLDQFPPDDVSSWLPTERVTLHHLRTLKWEWTSSDENALLFDYLNFPALRYLYWSEEKDDVDDIEDYEVYQASLDSFFGNLPAGQIQLYLSGFGLFSPDDIMIRLSTIFYNVPRLKKLTIDGEHDVLIVIIEMMEVARLNGQLLLPDLQIFCPSTRSYSGPTDLLYDFVVERRASGAAGIRLEVRKLSDGSEWTYAKKSSLRSMIQDGFKLEILENGEMVNWLEHDVAPLQV